MDIFNYNFWIYSIILKFVLGYIYFYTRRYTIMENMWYVQLNEYLNLSILTIIRVVLSFILGYTYIYTRSYTIIEYV